MLLWVPIVVWSILRAASRKNLCSLAGEHMEQENENIWIALETGASSLSDHQCWWELELEKDKKTSEPSLAPVGGCVEIVSISRKKSLTKGSFWFTELQKQV